MRPLIFLLIIGFSQIASAYACPRDMEKAKAADATLEFLNNFKGQFRLGDCQVEITTCDPLAEKNPGNPVAEIFLVDQNDREVYLSFEYPEKEGRLLKTKTIRNKRMLNYRKRDRHYEEELGRTEHYRLEILTDWDDLDVLGSIHLGVYSTNNQLNQWNGNDSTWSICKRK